MSGVKLKRLFVSYRRQKTQKHSVSIGLFCSGFSFPDLFIRKFTEAVFFIFKTVRCVWVERIWNNTLLFFILFGTASPLKTFYISMHSTRQKTWKRRRPSAIKKPLRFFWMLIDMSLPKFDIYQDTGTTNCFKSHTNSWCPHFIQEKFFSDVRSEIHLVWRNICIIYVLYILYIGRIFLRWKNPWSCYLVWLSSIETWIFF